jgi:hypothetical protein
MVVAGGAAMYYRACMLDKYGHIGCTVKLDCPDDDTAKQTAAGLLSSNDIELWQGLRKVADLKAHANDYRLYLYGKDGLLIDPAIIITADSDNAAIAAANKRVVDLGAELWDRHHIIKEFAPKD